MYDLYVEEQVVVLWKVNWWRFVTLLGRLPNFGSRPNTMGVKFPSVPPSTKSFDFDEISYTGSTLW